MKKKRVMAMFLALSMTFSSCSLPALASEQGVPEAILSQKEEEGQDNPDVDVEETQETETVNTGEILEEPAEKETMEAEEESVQKENADVADNPVMDENIETEQDEADKPVLEAVTENVQPFMMTFVDEVKMAVTYDANEASGYQYTVENGVLTAITTRNGSAVDGNVVLAEDQGITSIGSGAFKGNTEITYVKLPAGVVNIENDAFSGCISLKGATIPNGVRNIGEDAFKDCIALTQLALPKTLESIGARAFCGDSKLFMVYMKDASYSNLTYIGSSAFSGCGALELFCSDTMFTLPAALETIGDSAFEECVSIKSLTMPDTLSSLGRGAFYKCVSLKEISLSAKLSVISENSFEGCRSLITVKFANGNRTIENNAFKGCYVLNRVDFPFTMSEVGSYAFLNCSGLKAVKIPNGNMSIGENAFPNSENLYLIGFPGSTAELYASKCKVSFSAIDDMEQVQHFICDIRLSGTGSGNIKVFCIDKETGDRVDPNEQNEGQGVEAGEMIYVAVYPSSGSRLVGDSLKCNGNKLTKDSNGEYAFKMPSGGAVVTAEFAKIQEQTAIDGLADDVAVELSNGSQLKIGQYTRMFLLDSSTKDGTPIAVSKISFKSNKPEIATVSASGMIKALKEGDVKITATVRGGDGKTITKEVVISVRTVNVELIKLKASSYDPKFVTISAEGEALLAMIDQTAVKSDKTFRIEAAAYDLEDDNISTKLKWTTSDSKVAKLSAATSEANAPYNTVTIPRNASGEATITVTAINKDQTVRTQKFIVSVRDYTPRLAQSEITVNPYQTQGAELEIIGAYGKAVEAKTVKLLYADGKLESSDFLLDIIETDADNFAKFYVRPAFPSLEDGKYPVMVSINEGEYKVPLTIMVKRSVPNPTVSFDKKQQKMNLFYANDGVEIKPVVGKLGTAKISEYSLEPLSNSADDRLFTENFQINESGVITQKSTEGILYNSKKKPAVTGYLVLRYEGYQDTIQKKIKITIPTTTVTPSYQLNKSTDTYNISSDKQIITLQLLDKKTKKMIPLDETYTVTALASSTLQTEDPRINSYGEIELVIGKNSAGGRVDLRVTSSTWAKGQAFTFAYTLKATEKEPVISLTTSSVSLNKSYPEQVLEFGLKSNQYGTKIDEKQIFTANSTTKTAEQYQKLEVTYEEGRGTVKILDPTISNGTYKFSCYVRKAESAVTWNKVTLSVKVAQSRPSVSIKGSAALNLLAVNDEKSYTETAEFAISAKNLQTGYALDSVKTIETISCTTKKAEGAQDCFEWKIEDGKLKVGLKEEISAKSYTFSMIPVFKQEDGSNIVEAGKISFSVKVYKGTISATVSAKGKINLLDRVSTAYTDKNSIIYTPKLKNLKDTVVEARIYDAAERMPQYQDPESSLFRAEVKGGKIYVVPRDGAAVENNKTYSVRIWVKLQNYAFEENGGGLWCTGIQEIKTAQIMPSVETDRTNVKLYLSNKGISARFQVKSKVGSIGKISKVVFDEKDKKSLESFEIMNVSQEDGSLQITLKLKNTVSYTCNSINKIKMYVVYEGQGINTSGTPITVNVTISK